MLPYTYSGMRPLSEEDLYSVAGNQEPEFGTNTGRQGIFDPENMEHKTRAINRLSELESQYGDKLQYGYTGETGVQDATGWSQYQNAITEADNIRRIMAGEDPRGIKFGGTQGGPMRGLAAGYPTLSKQQQQATGTGDYFQSQADWMKSKGY